MPLEQHSLKIKKSAKTLNNKQHNINKKKLKVCHICERDVMFCLSFCMSAGLQNITDKFSLKFEKMYAYGRKTVITFWT